jgi:hypothetical protein
LLAAIVSQGNAGRNSKIRNSGSTERYIILMHSATAIQTLKLKCYLVPVNWEIYYFLSSVENYK